MHASAMILESNRAQRLFACLGDPSRFRVVTTLFANEYCVTDLARQIGLSQSCTTRHLQALQREGFVIGLRRGKRVVFRLNTDEPMVAGLVAWVSSHQTGAAFLQATLDPGRTSEDNPASAEVLPPATPARRDQRPAPDGLGRRDLEDFLL
jgi:DNA-binding transcriptional ArsR family regulator